MYKASSSRSTILRNVAYLEYAAMIHPACPVKSGFLHLTGAKSALLPRFTRFTWGNPRVKVLIEGDRLKKVDCLTNLIYDAIIIFIMKTISATVSKRGYIVLPARLRKEMGIKAGTKVLLLKDENRIILQPIGSFTQSLKGLTAQSFGKNPSEIKEYIDGGREER